MRTPTLVFLALLLFRPALADEPAPVAVFDMSFVNFSQEVDYGATNEAEKARIVMLSDYFRELLAGTGHYAPVELGPVAEDIARNHNDVFHCNLCEAPMARKLGVGRSFTGTVQKLSVLVQTIIVRETDAETGEVVALYQTDIRGNTDEAWRRGLKWLVDNRVMAGG